MTRVAVIGLFNSGSTCVAGCLHHLGADMGSPFWGPYFEPYDLAVILRSMWKEPLGRSDLTQSERIEILRNWMLGREADSTAGLIGAKHPLLTLSACDLQVAWGPEAKFIWAYRDLNESIAQLHKRGWFGTAENREAIQRKLWHSINAFSPGNANILKLPYLDMMTNPSRQLDSIAQFLNISPTREQFARACGSVVPHSD